MRKSQTILVATTSQMSVLNTSSENETKSEKSKFQQMQTDLVVAKYVFDTTTRTKCETKGADSLAAYSRILASRSR